MAGATLTPDTICGTNFTLDSRAARNIKIITGSWSVASTYEANGITVNIASLGIAEPLFVKFTALENEVHYDYTNDALLFYYVSATATNSYAELPTDSVMTNHYGTFLVIGR